MISRIILLESNLNITKKFRPPISITNYDSKLKLSTCQLMQVKENYVSKHIKSPSPSLGKKAKEATKTTYYTAVVLAGVGAFGLMMYAIFKELLSSFSPQSVYSAAVDKLCTDPRILNMFGENIKCFGETSRRGRRQHINHFLYEVDGKKGIRIKFYLQGRFRSGIVHLDARQTPIGWEFRYLFVQMDSYPHDVVVVEDNRSFVDSEDSLESNSSPLLSLPSLKES